MQEDRLYHYWHWDVNIEMINILLHWNVYGYTVTGDKYH